MRREERAPRRLRELRGMVVFELERVLSSRRVGAALVILLAAVFVASERLSVLAGQQGSLAGATALDGFYFALNDQTVAALLLPTACLVLCGSLFSGDAEDEMGLLLVSRLRWRSDYVAAKLVATFAGCLFCVAALFALALLVGAVAGGLTLGDGGVPEWLAGGSVESLPFSDYGPIPADWCYPVVLLGLAFLFGLLETALVCFAQAVYALFRCRSRWAPVIGSAFALGVLLGVGDLIRSIGVALGANTLTSSFGWASDRLCLGSYRLGAGFFQTSAGAEAVSAGSGALTAGYRINSFFELALLITALLVFSLVIHAVLLRRSRCPEREGLQERKRSGGRHFA